MLYVHVFSTLLRTDVGGFLKHINSIDGQIEFTVKEESNGRFPFLDASIDRMDPGFLVMSVFSLANPHQLSLEFQFQPLEQRKGCSGTGVGGLDRDHGTFRKVMWKDKISGSCARA